MCLSVVGLLASGCSLGPVEVDAPELSGTAAEACADLVRSLPDRVDGAGRTEIEPEGAPAGAWGDPPIVLRCGVPMPDAFDRFATCQVTNGVGWFIPQDEMTGEPGPITMTTIGRDVNVEVRLPTEHWPPAAAMVDLAPAIKQATTEESPCV